MKEQRRGRRIAMTPEERDEYLRVHRTCRVATVGAGGAPHNSALWYVWDGTAIWLNTLVKSQRWVNLQRDPRVSVLVDDGEEYLDLRGVEIIGEAAQVGEAPRGTGPDPALEATERLYGDKYAGGSFVPDGQHAWVRVVPEKIVSWDFPKLKQG